MLQDFYLLHCDVLLLFGLRLLVFFDWSGGDKGDGGQRVSLNVEAVDLDLAPVSCEVNRVTGWVLVVHALWAGCVLGLLM